MSTLVNPNSLFLVAFQLTGEKSTNEKMAEAIRELSGYAKITDNVYAILGDDEGKICDLLLYKCPLVPGDILYVVKMGDMAWVDPRNDVSAFFRRRLKKALIC